MKFKLGDVLSHNLTNIDGEFFSLSIIIAINMQTKEVWSEITDFDGVPRGTPMKHGYLYLNSFKSLETQTVIREATYDYEACVEDFSTNPVYTTENGNCTINASISHACTCPMRDLLMNGCKCGGV